MLCSDPDKIDRSRHTVDLPGHRDRGVKSLCTKSLANGSRRHHADLKW